MPTTHPAERTIQLMLRIPTIPLLTRQLMYLVSIQIPNHFVTGILTFEYINILPILSAEVIPVGMNKLDKLSKQNPTKKIVIN